MSYDPGAWQRNPDGFITKGNAVEKINDEGIRPLDWTISSGAKSVLDVGCINGRYIDWLRRKGYSGEYLGVDITPAFLESARQRHPKEKFESGDIRTLSYKNSHDLVLCLNILQHLAPHDWKAAVGNVFAASRKHVVFSVYGSLTETKSSHDQNFLNWWFSKSDFLSLIPDGWQAKEVQIFEPPWDKSVVLIQTWHEKAQSENDHGLHNRAVTGTDLGGSQTN